MSAVAIVTELDPDDDDAQAATRAILGAYLGPSRSVGSVRRRASATRIGWHVEEIDAVLDDGTILELELKDMAPASRSPASRSNTPAFVFNRLREIVVYDELLSAGAFGTPTFYGARVDQMVGRYWVLLRRLGGRSLGEPLIHRDGISATAEAELERWHAAVRRPPAGTISRLLRDARATLPRWRGFPHSLRRCVLLALDPSRTRVR